MGIQTISTTFERFNVAAEEALKIVAVDRRIAVQSQLPESWCRHADLVGNVRILRLSSFLAVLIPVLWLFSQNPAYLLLVQMFAGFAWSGVTLSAANFIYGYNSKLPPLDPNAKGHYHPEGAEYWLIMKGQIRYPIERIGVIIAEEGDVVYVPRNTFHFPRWWGDGASCRLAMNGFPDISHLFEAH